MGQATSQPSGPVVIYTANPITDGLLFAEYPPITGRTAVSTPYGNAYTGVDYPDASGEGPISIPANTAGTSGYTLFAVGYRSANAENTVRKYLLRIRSSTVNNEGFVIGLQDYTNSVAPRCIVFYNDGSFTNTSASDLPAVSGQLITMGAVYRRNNATGLRFFIDGTQVAAEATSDKNLFTTESGIYVSDATGGVANTAFPALMVAVWDRSLSDAEIDSLNDNPWQIFDDGAGDTTAPILTSAVGTATGATTATGSVTTDEAGPAWAVLTGSSTTPSEAQIKAGQSHTGAAAAASDTATLVVGANADVFDFAGLTGSTAYWLHVVQDDTATPTANTSSPITSASSFTTDAPSDTTNPTMNGSITVGTKTANSISISYSAASDNVGVTGYEVSSNGGSSWLDNGTSLSYTFLGLSPLTPYDLAVRAKDAAGNRATPITVNTSTYREGGTVQDVYDNTGAVGGNPQGVLYATAAALVGTEPNSWLSYYTVSGPTPSGGTLDASPLGDFEYFGPDAAIWTVQPERNGVDYGDPVVVELYDQTKVATPANSNSPSTSGASSATQTQAATPAGSQSASSSTAASATQEQTATAAASNSPSTSTASSATQGYAVAPADSLSGSTSTASSATQEAPTGLASPVDSVSGSTSEASAAIQTYVAAPAGSVSHSSSTSARAINLNLTLDPDFAEYPIGDGLVAEFSE